MFGARTVFAAGDFSSVANHAGFEILPLSSLSGGQRPAKTIDHVILHYVNYGYQNRGLPFGLVRLFSNLPRSGPDSFLTIFHELYASGPPWRSAFWLRPLQKRIARSIARLSGKCIVSSETARAQLNALAPHVRCLVHPVFSNFGEPSISLEQIAGRNPHRWAICGGTALVEQSLRSFLQAAGRIPDPFRVRELVVLGGTDNPVIRAMTAKLGELGCQYHPKIDALEASRLLSGCSFAWIDYFHRPDVPSSIVLKSTAFAAACAHGIIPVFPHSGSAISLDGDCLPGPFFIAPNASDLPPARAREKVGWETYRWYRKHAASKNLAQGVARELGLAGPEVLLRDSRAHA